MLFTFILFSLFFVFLNKNLMYNHKSREKNLYFVFTTFRHGARNPLYSSDAFGNKISHPGKLTKYGCFQHLEIGQKYRQRYSNFINLKFDKKEIYIRSSNIDRAIISTEKELKGFFSKNIDRKYIHIIKGGSKAWNLFHFNDKEKKKMEVYINSCKICQKKYF